MAKEKPMTKKQNKITIEDILNEFYLDVEDGGSNYDVIFKNKTNGDDIFIFTRTKTK